MVVSIDAVVAGKLPREQAASRAETAVAEIFLIVFFMFSSNSVDLLFEFVLFGVVAVADKSETAFNVSFFYAQTAA